MQNTMNIKLPTLQNIKGGNGLLDNSCTMQQPINSRINQNEVGNEMYFYLFSLGERHH